MRKFLTFFIAVLTGCFCFAEGPGDALRIYTDPDAALTLYMSTVAGDRSMAKSLRKTLTDLTRNSYLAEGDMDGLALSERDVETVVNIYVGGASSAQKLRVEGIFWVTGPIESELDSIEEMLWIFVDSAVIETAEKADAAGLPVSALLHSKTEGRTVFRWADIDNKERGLNLQIRIADSVKDKHRKLHEVRLSVRLNMPDRAPLQTVLGLPKAQAKQPKPLSPVSCIRVGADMEKLAPLLDRTSAQMPLQLLRRFDRVNARFFFTGDFLNLVADLTSPVPKTLQQSAAAVRKQLPLYEYYSKQSKIGWYADTSVRDGALRVTAKINMAQLLEVLRPFIDALNEETRRLVAEERAEDEAEAAAEAAAAGKKAVPAKKEVR